MGYTEKEKEKCVCGDIRLAHISDRLGCIYCNCKKFRKCLKQEQGEQHG